MIPLQTTSDCNSEMPMVPVCHGNLQYLARNPRSRLRCDPRALVAEWARGRPVQPPAQAQTEAGNSGSTRAQPAVAQLAAAVQPPVSDTQAAAPPAYPAAREQTAAPENALAVARTAEAKRAAEKRRAERRQLWAEKRRQRQQQELRAVERKVREDTEPRQFAAEPVRMQTPQFRLFGSE